MSVPLPAEVYTHIFHFLHPGYTFFNVAASCPTFCRLLRYAHKEFDRRQALRAYAQAAERGNLELLQWLGGCDIYLTQGRNVSFTKAAAKRGNTTVLELLAAHHTLCPTGLFVVDPPAAVINWFIDRFPNQVTWALTGSKYALIQQNWRLLQQLVDGFQLIPGKADVLFYWAAKRGGASMLQQLESRYRAVYRPSQAVLLGMSRGASQRGQLAELKHIFRSHPAHCSSLFVPCICEAIMYRRLDLVQWLFDFHFQPGVTDLLQGQPPSGRHFSCATRFLQPEWIFCETLQDFVVVMVKVGAHDISFLHWIFSKGLVDGQSLFNSLPERTPELCLYAFRQQWITEESHFIIKYIAYGADSTLQELFLQVGHLTWEREGFRALFRREKPLPLIQWLYSEGFLASVFSDPVLQLPFYQQAAAHAETWEWVLSTCPPPRFKGVLNISFLNCLLFSFTFRRVADISCLHWLGERGTPDDVDLLIAIRVLLGKKNDCEVGDHLQWLWSRLSPFLAAKESLVQTLRGHFFFPCNMSGLRWLRDTAQFTLKELLPLVGELTTVDPLYILQWLDVFGCDVESGQILTDRWLVHSCGGSWAAFQTLLQRLLGVGVPRGTLRIHLDDFVVACATKGNLNALKWLHQTFVVTRANCWKYRKHRKRLKQIDNMITRWLREQGIYSEGRSKRKRDT